MYYDVGFYVIGVLDIGIITLKLFSCRTSNTNEKNSGYVIYGNYKNDP